MLLKVDFHSASSNLVDHVLLKLGESGLILLVNERADVKADRLHFTPPF